MLSIFLVVGCFVIGWLLIEDRRVRYVTMYPFVFCEQDEQDDSWQ